MDNYAMAQEAARLYFLSYDQAQMAQLPGVSMTGSTISLPFLGASACIDRKTGHIFFPEEENRRAGFGEALSVYDWLCCQKPGAIPAKEYCPVHSLPGVMVRGKGLSMTGGKLPAFFDIHPERLAAAALAMGGDPIALGDLGVQLPLFSNLDVLLKFYHSDEDFPAALTLLWDKHILDFIKYETVYYVAGCLFARLRCLSSFEDTPF